MLEPTLKQRLAAAVAADAARRQAEADQTVFTDIRKKNSQRAEAKRIVDELESTVAEALKYGQLSVRLYAGDGVDASIEKMSGVPQYVRELLIAEELGGHLWVDVDLSGDWVPANTLMFTIAESKLKGGSP